MAYSTSYSLGGQSGSIGFVQESDPVLFSQIFSGSPVYYPGSTIRVQELMAIYTEIVDPTLVDRDFRWFSPREYRGNYQLIAIDGIPKHYPDDDGFIFHQIQYITRYSNYTVVADPMTPAASAEFSTTRVCNFYLQPEVYLFPEEATPVAGFRDHGIAPAFISAHSLSPAPLKDTVFNQKMGGLGLFLYPGVQGVRVDYSIAIINEVATDYPPIEAPTCQFAGSPSCDEEFTAFILNGVGPNGESPIYAQPSSCTPDQIPDERIFTCSNGETRLYYYCGGGN
jgi:hypothetical protein